MVSQVGSGDALCSGVLVDVAVEGVNIVDSHPGKWQDGISLLLCVARCSDSNGQYFVTGVRENPKTCAGMFSEFEEPIQVLRYDEGKWVFSMFNLGRLSMADADKVRSVGATRVENKDRYGKVLWWIEIQKVIEEDAIKIDQLAQSGLF